MSEKTKYAVNPWLKPKKKGAAMRTEEQVYAYTQSIGRLARLHYDGAIVPSAKRTGGVNLVLFRGLPE